MPPHSLRTGRLEGSLSGKDLGGHGEQPEHEPAMSPGSNKGILACIGESETAGQGRWPFPVTPRGCVWNIMSSFGLQIQETLTYWKKPSGGAQN